MSQNQDHQLYQFLENQTKPEKHFRPYELELNGCLRCFGRVSIDLKVDKLNNLSQETRTSQNRVIAILKRQLEITQITLKLTGVEQLKEKRGLFSSITVM